MPRTRDLAVAGGFGLVLIFSAAFVAEIRAAIVAAFPGQARTTLGGIDRRDPGDRHFSQQKTSGQGREADFPRPRMLCWRN